MKPHILIVDDEKQIRDVIGRFLTKRGYAVSAAENSAHARAVVANGGIDVAILDIELADEDGLELLALLKKDQPQLRVIILTGRGYEEELLQTARLYKADGYISKLLPIDQLLMEIRRVASYNHTDEAAA